LLISWGGADLYMDESVSPAEQCFSDRLIAKRRPAVHFRNDLLYDLDKSGKR
jgi:hypothetical protein